MCLCVRVCVFNDSVKKSLLQFSLVKGLILLGEVKRKRVFVILTSNTHILGGGMVVDTKYPTDTSRCIPFEFATVGRFSCFLFSFFLSVK